MQVFVPQVRWDQTHAACAFCVSQEQDEPCKSPQKEALISHTREVGYVEKSVLEVYCLNTDLTWLPASEAGPTRVGGGGRGSGLG